MNWKTIVRSLTILDRCDKDDPLVIDCVYDSRQVKPGSVFVAISGLQQQGDSFIHDAISRGAVAVISQNKLPQDCKVSWIQVLDPRLCMAIVAQKLWNVNFADFFAVGITGTNGKTTTATLYHHFFSTLFGQSASWLFSTIKYIVGTEEKEASRTTPEAVDLLRYVGNAVQKPKAVSMEVSSHALALARVEGFTFDIAVWTNLTQDHLDFHKTMQAYFDAKLALFSRHLKDDGIGIVNGDDPWLSQLPTLLPDKRIIRFGTSDTADVRIIGQCCTSFGTSISLQYLNRRYEFTSKLTGAFNVYNITGFVAGLLAKGFVEEQIQASLDSMQPVEGRMETIAVSKGFQVYVDYAHTPDALVNILKTVRDLTKGRLYCVFGCGGDRDKTKRPLMGEAVSMYADEAIVTSDNPRTEKPLQILDNIVKGIPLDYPHHVIADRREAIKYALSKAQKEDSIVIAGKGHETYQEIAGVKHPFDDRLQVKDICKEIGLSCGNK